MKKLKRKIIGILLIIIGIITIVAGLVFFAEIPSYLSMTKGASIGLVLLGLVMLSIGCEIYRLLGKISG